MTRRWSHPVHGGKLDPLKLHFRLTLCWLLHQEKHVFKARNMCHRKGGKFQTSVWLSFVYMPPGFMRLRNVHFHSLFSVTKTEHTSVKGWADGIQSGAERENVPHAVVPDRKRSETVGFSVCFTTLKCVLGMPFKTLGGKARCKYESHSDELLISKTSTLGKTQCSYWANRTILLRWSLQK